jgi:hypothetical protein
LFIYVKSDTDENQQIMLDDYFYTHAKDIGGFCGGPLTTLMLMHKRLGNPIAIWKDGGVVIVPPEEIVISPEFSNSED